MAQTRKKPIPENQQVILKAIGNKIRELRKGKELSIEKFCMENKIPRISYSNLEAGKNFQMTTLLAIIEAHPDVKSLADFFKDI
jgi:transcriptional regulator with XRE-family HTH domain